MKTRQLRDLTVSEIGMGCMGFSHGYGKVPDEDYSIEAIRKAYDYGCTFFDTAEVYGMQQFEKGHNERLVGKAIEPFRKEIILATKLHIDTDEVKTDGSLYNTIRRHLEASMQKLRTDYTDLYYLHRINPDIPVEGVADVMGRFIKGGLIRGWGLSMVNKELLERANKVTPVSAVQNIYSMLDRDYEKKVIPYCAENNIGFVAFSPIASGFLSGKVTTETKFGFDDVRTWVPQMKKENIIANQPVLDLISAYANQKNASNAQIALAWMLKKYPHIVPIPGSKNRERILENLGAWKTELTDDEFEALDAALSKIAVHGSRKDVGFATEYID